MTDLKPVVVSEINTLCENLPPEKPVPQRYLKSQKPKFDSAPADTSEGGPTGSAGVPDQEQVDLEDLIAPVDVLSNIPNDYWTWITEKKWQTRQDALKALQKVVDVPRIQPGDFGELVKSLTHVVNKDTNVVLVTLATEILGQLANGLKKKYAPYAQHTVSTCLGKFKERKPTLITALRTTVDAAMKATTLDAVVEDVVSALQDKSPSIRAETALFLSRLFPRCSPAMLSKKLLKTLTVALCETSKDTSGDVRENSFAALGAAMRVVGAKAIEPFLGDLDALRMAKVKEHCEAPAAESKEGAGKGAVEDRPGTASEQGKPVAKRPATAKPSSKDSGDDNAAAADAPSRPATAAPVKRKPPAAKPTTAAAKATASAAPTIPTETLLSDEQCAQKASELFGEELPAQLGSADWKERNAAVQELQSRCTAIGLSELPTQVVCRTVMRKPGLKDTNIVVLRSRVELLQSVLDAAKSVSSNLSELLLPELLDKIGDAKLCELIKTLLTTLAERCDFPFVGTQILKTVNQLKNPRSQADTLNWLSQAIREFGMKLPPQDLIAAVRSGLNATNPAVRQATISLAGSMHLFMGDPLRNLLADEKPAIVSLLSAEFEKNAGQKPPAPIRGQRSGTSGVAGQGDDDEVAEGVTEPATEEVDAESFLPRVDIRDKLTPNILEGLGSKAWKERQEALNQVQEILQSAKHIEGSSGGLQPTFNALAKLCSDANKILSKASLTLLGEFGKALPKSDAVGYLKVVEPAILLCLGDSKVQNREAARAALCAWQSRVPFSALVEDEMISEALKLENPNLRAELLSWLTAALTDLPVNYRRQLPPNLTETLMPHVFAAMEDRNPEARKQAQLSLPQLIRVLGWDPIAKAAGKLKSTSKDTVMPHLEKARESVKDSMASKPAAETKKPAIRGGGGGVPSSKTGSTPPSPPPEDSEDTTSSSAAPSARGSKKKPDAKKPASAASSKRPVAEEPPVVVLMQANKTAKAARLADEKKRKLLKWEFDTPTREHVQQLNQLFAAAGTAPDLHALLFHTDFKQHLKGLDQLNRFLDTPEGEEATLVNIDLILRWIVLRFFETNPVVIGRCLDYVTKLFSQLSESGVSLTDHDVGTFLPFLVLKAGDSKDAVRQSVRGIFRVVVNLYPPSRLFTALANGMKSKINKTRQECIDEMGSLIERFGVNVCQPSVPVALKTISQQIGDRDSGVRTAALNALVSAYALVGEQLWKIIGNLSDKDRTMLEERIKRAGRQPVSSSTEPSEPVSARSTVDRRNRDPSDPRQPPEVARMAPKAAAPMSSCHQRALAMLNELGDLSPEKAPNMPQLNNLDADISDLFQPVELPTLKTHARQSVLNALLRTSPDTASAITMVVTAISSSDFLVSCHALAELDMVLRDDKWSLLVNHVNQILMLITMQLKQVTTRYFGDPSVSGDELRTLLRCHLATIDSLFQRTTLAREASRETLRELIQALLQVMIDERTTEIPDGENVIRAINSLCIRIIDAANGTRVLSAFIRLLHESVSNGNFTNRFTQSVMKTLWRITKGMESAENNYSFDVILLDCHHFLKAFPSASWKTRKSDVPIRTIKTLLHVMCRMQGPSILDLLETIPNKEDSELEAYLNRTLKTIGSSGPSATVSSSDRPSVNSDTRTKNTLPSAATREKLTDIFKKIGSNEPEEGLNELYDFTQMYPEMDLSVFLSKTSQFFQTYIKQALKNIAIERARRTKGSSGFAAGDGNRLRASMPGPLSELITDASGVDPKVFMNRLAQLRRELGLGGVSTTNVDDEPGEPLGATQMDGVENTIRSPALETTLRNMVNPAEAPVQAESSQPESRPTISANELLEIRRRLERIKSGQVV
ncbi:Cytoskeleton associated protein 5 [Clonorchis sinensis]|uniref:Cytoskeleton associated protein 5 n=1 Tax=Clonorchis sinensis TaxID=79923 RepID=A0A8T1MDH6_CLOSI|nr:Cytoskeleton associated protein 5 [Clonorchis sinensis]